MTYRMVILSPPRTKKNSLRRIKRGNRVFTVGSEAAVKWEQAAVWQLRTQWRQAPMSSWVQVSAAVYRETAIGDLVGYLQAIGDALEKGGVIVNDRLIASWDGSRLLKDANNPRVEIEIEVMA